MKFLAVIMIPTIFARDGTQKYAGKCRLRGIGTHLQPVIRTDRCAPGLVCVKNDNDRFGKCRVAPTKECTGNPAPTLNLICGGYSTCQKDPACVKSNSECNYFCLA